MAGAGVGVGPSCKICATELTQQFVDLGVSPPCENFLTLEQTGQMEAMYPLRVLICEQCLLVQLPTHVGADEIFGGEYAYFSSFSDSWVDHARRYTDAMVERLGLGPDSLVVEAASNDGYLLQHFVERGIPALGLEPAPNVAEAARERGVETEVMFVGATTAAGVRERRGAANLVVANNVYAHVPDLVDFTRGLRALMADDGWLTVEVQHLLRLIENSQFDTIYHEHFEYYTLLTLQRALATGGLAVVDVEELSTHGGSLRVFARPVELGAQPSDDVRRVLDAEQAAGLHSVAGHAGFADAVRTIKVDLLEFLIQAARDGKTVAGYGAPGKGNTLLNHCGIRTDLMAFTVDRNPYKHGRFLPGTHIPVHAPERLAETRPDYVLVMPWNLRTELDAQLGYVRDWGGRLVYAIPSLEVV